jgi:hypothetical protein
MYIECHSHADQARCVLSLRDACTGVETKHLRSVPNTDVRVQSVRGVRTTAESALLTLNLLHNWGDASPPEIRALIPRILGMNDITQEQVSMAATSLAMTNKLQLALIGQFMMENAMATIHRALTGAPIKKTGFHAVAKALVIDKLGLAATAIDTLMVVAHIRNSLHGNGIHHAKGPMPPTWKHTIDGVEYVFEDGKKVSCADAQHIAHALEGALGVLESVFVHPAVVGGTFPDAYALQVTTAP